MLVDPTIVGRSYILPIVLFANHTHTHSHTSISQTAAPCGALLSIVFRAQETTTHDHLSLGLWVRAGDKPCSVV